MPAIGPPELLGCDVLFIVLGAPLAVMTAVVAVFKSGVLSRRERTK